MTRFSRHSRSLLCASLMGFAPVLHAEKALESQLAKLAEDEYSVRMEAKEALVALCTKNPVLIDAVIRLTLDSKADPEQAFICKEIIRTTFEKSIFVESGDIGFALDNELIVTRLEENGPAMHSGIQMKSRLLSIAGKSVKGKRRDQIYAMIHATKPGTKLEMEFLVQDGEKLIYYPEVAPRSTIFPHENMEQRKQQAYSAWIKRKRREIQKQQAYSAWIQERRREIEN